MADKENMEDVLMKHLSSPNMDKTSLRHYSTVISHLQKQNLVVERVFWKGIIWPDTFVAQARIGLDDIDVLKKLFGGRNIYAVEMFPLGIINPEAFQLNILVPRFNPQGNQQIGGGG